MCYGWGWEEGRTTWRRKSWHKELETPIALLSLGILKIPNNNTSWLFHTPLAQFPHGLGIPGTMEMNSCQWETAKGLASTLQMSIRRREFAFSSWFSLIYLDQHSIPPPSHLDCMNSPIQRNWQNCGDWFLSPSPTFIFKNTFFCSLQLITPFQKYCEMKSFWKA